MIRKQVLRAWEHSRTDLLETEKPQIPEQKLILSITCYPTYNGWTTYILLSSNKEHKRVFPNVPVIGFRNGKRIIRIT